MAQASVPRPSQRVRGPRLKLSGLEGRLPILLGVVLAVVAATLVYVGQQRAREDAVVPPEVTPVVVAATSIGQGTLLTTSNIPTLFKIARVPSSGVTQDAVTTLTGLDGQVTAAPLAAGDRLLASQLTPPADSTASGPRAALLPPGSVAIVLPVNDNISVGGAIVPTDRVDVIATIPVPVVQDNGKSTDSLVTQAILRDVRVLATGFRTHPPGAAAATSPQPEPADANPTPYSTLTLALAPQDAVMMQHLLAQNVRLALALRRPGEQTVPTSPVTSAEIARRLGLTGQPAAPGTSPSTAQAPPPPASPSTAQAPVPPTGPAAQVPPSPPILPVLKAGQSTLPAAIP